MSCLRQFWLIYMALLRRLIAICHVTSQKWSLLKARVSKISWHGKHTYPDDEDRLEVTNAVDESSVLLVQDWAMKFLPRKFP